MMKRPVVIAMATHINNGCPIGTTGIMRNGLNAAQNKCKRVPQQFEKALSPTTFSKGLSTGATRFNFYTKMKRIFMTIGVAVVALTTAAAQESTDVLTNKAGKPILPTAGNYAVGLDASPFLNYAGHLFSNNGASAPKLQFSDGVTVYGKYFLSDKTALRAKLLVDYGSKTDVTLVDKAGATSTDGSQVEQVENKTRTSNLGIGVSAGLEKRFGDTRWQFFYGADASLGIGFSGNKHYTYGNALSSTYTSSGRPLKETYGTTFSIGANVFGGVEYFVAPRISVGGELGWGISYSRTGTGTEESEAWENNAVKTSEKEVEGGRGASFNLQNFSSSINVIFYF
jgi:hypothetical protein